MDRGALKAALLRAGMMFAFFGVIIAAVFALVVAIDLLPGVSRTMAQISLLLIMFVWLIRSMYTEAKNNDGKKEEDNEGDDSE